MQSLEPIHNNNLPALSEPPQLAIVKASGYSLPPVTQSLVAKVAAEISASRWLITSGIATGLLAGFSFAAWRVPLYDAHASLEVQLGEHSAAQNHAGQNTDVDDDSASALETQIRLLRSHAILERAANHLPEGDKERLVERPRWGLPPQDVIDTVARRLAITSSATGRIIDIRFLCPDPHTGADFVNVLAQEISNFGMELQWKSVQRSSEWLQPQLNDARNKLEESEKQLDEYSRGMEAALPTDGSALETQWALARGNRIQRQAQYESLRLAPGEDQSRQGKLLAGQAKSRYEAALAREETLATELPPERLETLENAGNQAPESAARYALLNKETEANRQLYQTLSTRIAEAAIAASSKNRGILLLDSAYAAQAPVTPNVPIDAAAGAGLGALASLGFVLFRRAASTKFSQPGTVGQILSLPELGSVPKAQPRTGMPGHKPGGIMPFSGIEEGAQSESYRAIRSSLLFQSSERAQRCLVFTSAAAGEGKTTVVTNLAVSLAATNRRVLIIDGDLRRPNLHRIFGVERTPGLSDLLRRDRLIGSAGNGSSHFVAETAVHNLYLLPCGSAGGDAPEQLTGDRLPSLLRELRKNFDLILIDTPPILPCADARSFARAADGVVLIVRADETERREAGIARDTLLHDGSRVIGTVLTGFDPRRSAYRQHGYPS